jgi:hypothetical protein
VEQDQLMYRFFQRYEFHVLRKMIDCTYGIWDSDEAPDWYFRPSSEFSHSILAMAISQVSLTERSGSDKYSRRIGTELLAEMAPIASAA